MYISIIDAFENTSLSELGNYGDYSSTSISTSVVSIKIGVLVPFIFLSWLRLLAFVV